MEEGVTIEGLREFRDLVTKALYSNSVKFMDLSNDNKKIVVNFMQFMMEKKFVFIRT